MYTHKGCEQKINGLYRKYIRVRVLRITPINCCDINVFHVADAASISYQSARSFCFIFTVLGPVRNIATDDVSPDTLTISWGLQNESPCPTDTHIVEYSLTNRDQCDPIVDPEVIKLGNVTGTDVSITGLHPHSAYNVSVYSSNDKGRGGLSSITNVTSESGE